LSEPNQEEEVTPWQLALVTTKMKEDQGRTDDTLYFSHDQLRLEVKKPATEIAPITEAFKKQIKDHSNIFAETVK
jgi:hypothetical protein